MTSERLAWLFGLFVLLAGGWWFSANTEWVDEDGPRAARGEARDNPVYAFEHLLRQLGMTVAHHEALDPMPPEGARLVLLSNDWELMPGRAESLHQWVLRGGHLVLLQGTEWDDTRLEDWVPVDVVDVNLARPPGAAASAPVAASAPGHAASGPVTALMSSPPLREGSQALSACAFFPPYRKLQAKLGLATPWAVTRGGETQALRVPMGQGSVTLLNTDSALLHNAQALRCDNPLLLAAAVQAEPGATTWIYLNEKREALLPWLWHRGWIAIVAGLLALAAALWRGAVRFGPRLAAPPRLRRSISEQVRGLGAYLHREGRDALLTAQRRALDEAAARVLPGYSRLPASERVGALAEATRLGRDELSTALSARTCSRAELPQCLQVLETARRRLPPSPSGTAARAPGTHDER